MRLQKPPARTLLGRLGSHEAGLLGTLGLVAAGLLVFVPIAWLAASGSSEPFDGWAVRQLRDPSDPGRPYGPPWLAEMARDVTALGSASLLWLLTVAVLGFLWLAGRRRTTLFVGIAVGGGELLTELLKSAFDRPRPAYSDIYVVTSSFPSGHSMMSAVTYLTLGALLARVLPRRRLRAYVLILAALISVAVGASRVYLGVHWPTDVLAGWTAGAFWALLCSTVARRLQHRGDIETGPA